MKQDKRERRKAWNFFRFVLLAAAVSLLAYIPYKYATGLHATQGVYFYLFPLSGVVALLGIVLSVRPALGFRLPLWARAGVATVAMGWIATGILCIPSLTRMTLAAPLAGLFATFHMAAQHLFLSGAVVFLLLAPHSVYSLFGVTSVGVGERLAALPRLKRSS